MTAMTELDDAVRRERESLLAYLETLSPEQWATPSLCAGWSVQEVAAHLAYASALTARVALTELARARFRLNPSMRDSAVRWARRGTPAILDQLRRNAEANARSAGMPRIAVLVDAVVHTLDIRRPLGKATSFPASAFVPVADFCVGMRWPSTTLLGGQVSRRIAGLHLVAEDQPWSTGDGPEVRGSAEALLLVLSGRPVAAEELSGPGASTLVARL